MALALYAGMWQRSILYRLHKKSCHTLLPAQRRKASARYTQSFKPVRIAQCWRLFDEVGTALKVERFIKKCDRTTKERWVHHPEELGVIVSKKLGLDLVLLPFDSLIVEKESEKLDWKMVKSGHDPFAQISPSVDRGGVEKNFKSLWKTALVARGSFVARGLTRWSMA